MTSVFTDGSGFAQALATWRDISLSTLQKSLDASGLEIVENQKDSLMGRKKLAEQTRNFKKMPDEEKVAAFKALLKAYQTEIDTLTKRSKTSESAFLNLYKLLAEAPDPYPLLEAAIDQTVRATEAKLVESELEKAKDQIKTLKNQLKEAEKIEKESQKQTDKLEKLETKLDEMVKVQVSNKEAELDAVYGERIMNFQQREKDLIKQLELAKKQLTDLRMSNESNQAKILDDSSRRGFETVSRRAEIELVELDLERSRRRIEEVERRNENLRAEIEAVRSGREAQERIQTLESRISELQSEATRLLSTLEAQKNTIDEYQDQRSKIETGFTRQIKKLEQEISSLKEKLSQYADYDEIKRELEIIKYVEFASLNPEDEENAGFDDCSPNSSSLKLEIKMPNPNASKSNKQKTKPLETLLISKNRKLQDDLTTLRVMHDDLLMSSRMNTIESERLKSELEKLKGLNEKLENDLSRIQTNSTAGGLLSDELGGLIGRKSTNNLDRLSSSVEKNRGTPIEDLILENNSSPKPLSRIPLSHPNIEQNRITSDSSILPIITSQRDRFRQRNSELEEELRKQFETITITRNEMKNLQNDNLKLYEKVRYLQSYRDDNLSGSSSNQQLPSYSFNRFSSSNAVSRKDEELSRYHGIYEEHMNPFAKFRGRERLGALQALNPVDKLVLYTANFILGNRLTRNLFLIYVLILHCLLFITYGELAWRSDYLQQRTLKPLIPVEKSS